MSNDFGTCASLDHVTWVNPCGGLFWRTLADGRIEIQGGGTPEYPPDSAAFKNLALTWKNWAPEFQSAAKRFGVPVGWLVSIANAETGFVAHNKDLQRTIPSSDGYGSIGIMQPLAMVAQMYGYNPAARSNPQTNIDIGARLLADNARKNPSGFPAVAAMYNSGKVCKPGNDAFNLAGHQGKYATTAIRGLNTAIRYLPLSATPLWIYALGGAAVVAGGAWLYASTRRAA